MDLLGKIQDKIVQPFISLLFVIAFLYFVWGIVEYIQGASEPGKRIDGRNHMIWGVVGLFIMVSVVAILNIVCATVECM